MAINAKSFFGGGSAPSMPALPPLTPPPAMDTAGMTVAAERRRRRLGLLAPAKNGTLLTGPSGITTAPPAERTTLLGG